LNICIRKKNYYIVSEEESRYYPNMSCKHFCRENGETTAVVRDLRQWTSERKIKHANN